MTNLFESLSNFLKGENEAKVTFGLDTALMVKAGVIVIITVALSIFLTKIIK